MPAECVSCGSTDFILTDGFFYCGVCGVQSQTQREMDEEEEDFFNATLGFKLKGKCKSKTTEGRSQEIKKKIVVDEEKYCFLPSTPEVDYPPVLGRVGCRLATFCMLLKKYCDILIRDFSVPETVKKHVRYLLEMYLKKFDIAFCDAELDSTNPYVRITRNMEYESQLNDLLERKKNEKRKELESGLNLLTQLSSGIFDETLDASTLVLQDDEIEKLEKIMQEKTSLSRVAVARLSVLPLSDSILLMILYMACLYAGCTWMVPSDVTRWFREGRLPLSHLQRIALFPANKYTEDDIAASFNFYSTSASILPVHYDMRTVFALSQITDTPVQAISMDFEQIIWRFCFNLNLPNVFLERVKAICSVCPPSCWFDEKVVRRFGDFNAENYLKASVSLSRKYVLYGFEWETCCKKNKLFVSKVKDTVLPTVEVKAVAVILFCLKLVFGLEDSNIVNGIGNVKEHGTCIGERSKYAASNDGANNKRMMDSSNFQSSESKVFDFSVWLHQLQMRMDVWNGRGILEVIGKRSKPLPDVGGNKAFTVRQAKYLKREHRSLRIAYEDNDETYNFQGCVPNCDIQMEKGYSFYRIFADDLEPKPVEYQDMEAFLAPLRFQATRYSSWYQDFCSDEEHRNEKIDFYNAGVYFKSFDDYKINEKQVLDGKNVSKTHNIQVDDMSKDEMDYWNHLFPCHKSYRRYSRPLYSKYMCRYGMASKKIFDPCIYTSASRIIYKCAQRDFSDSFARLLEIFAMMIGEEPCVLYVFYLMLEMQFLNKKFFKKLRRVVKSDTLLPIYSVINQSCVKNAISSMLLKKYGKGCETHADCRYKVVKYSVIHKSFKEVSLLCRKLLQNTDLTNELNKTMESSPKKRKIDIMPATNTASLEADLETDLTLDEMTTELEDMSLDRSI